MGIEINPSTRVITTEKSVAGRGVFAVGDLVQDEIVGLIPTYAFFHPRNCASMFPEIAAQLNTVSHERASSSSCPSFESSTTMTDEKGSKQNWLGRLKRRLLFRRQQKAQTAILNDNNADDDGEQEEFPWQVELTEYALAALKSEHPLSPWIQQWQRDDPVMRMFQKGVTLDDQESIAATAQELQQLVPDLPRYKLLAALNIRLEQYQAFQSLFAVSNPKATDTAAMYSLCSSRTIEVAEGVVAALPFHDMINHSFEPNVGLAISDDGQHMELLALKDVAAGEELFLCYSKLGQEYDEDAAVWMLVQWGIPVSKSDWKVTVQPERETEATQ